jgi:xanthine dehydrogenase molybdopterin-binding subunit B
LINWSEHEIKSTKFWIGCAREAIYCDDIPSPPHCLHAAFVLSTEPYARIKGIDTAEARKSVGAVDFVSTNVGMCSLYQWSNETLFAEDIVGYVGQPLGAVGNSISISCTLCTSSLHYCEVIFVMMVRSFLLYENKILLNDY